jgi:hypothetical protein
MVKYTHSLNIKEPQAKEVIHVCKDYWPGALITLGPKKWVLFALSRVFFGAKAGSQSAIPEDSSRARAACVIARHVRTSQTIFFSLSREAGRTNRPTDRSFGVRAD